MKLQAKQTSKWMVEKWKWYKVIAMWSCSDWSRAIDLYSLCTATGKAVTYVQVVTDSWCEMFPSITLFDLSPIYSRMNWLDKLLNEDYFTTQKIGEIKEAWKKLKSLLSEKNKKVEKMRIAVQEAEKELEWIEQTYSELSEAFEDKDSVVVEKIIKESEYLTK